MSFIDMKINLLVRNGEGSMLMQQGGMQSKELGLKSFPKNIRGSHKKKQVDVERLIGEEHRK